MQNQAIWTLGLPAAAGRISPNPAANPAATWPRRAKDAIFWGDLSKNLKPWSPRPPCRQAGAGVYHEDGHPQIAQIITDFRKILWLQQ